MVAPIEFKRRVRLSEGIEPVVRPRGLPGFLLPVAAYWLGCGVLIHGVSTGSIQLDRLWTLARSVSLSREEPPSEPAPAAGLPSRPRPTGLRSRFGSLRAPPASEPFAEPALRQSLHLAATELEAAPDPEASARPAPAPIWALPLREVDPAPNGVEPPGARRAQTEAMAATADGDPADLEPPIGASLGHALHEAPPPETKPTVRPMRTYPSCESATEAARQDVDLTASRNAIADLPREAFARVLDHGGYLIGCGIPNDTSVDVCVAIQSGRVVGVTVATRPASTAMQRCIADAVQGLSFPSHPKVDVARTHFRAVR